jgi:hypothetical protein
VRTTKRERGRTDDDTERYDEVVARGAVHVLGERAPSDGLRVVGLHLLAGPDVRSCRRRGKGPCQYEKLEESNGGRELSRKEGTRKGRREKEEHLGRRGGSHAEPR